MLRGRAFNVARTFSAAFVWWGRVWLRGVRPHRADPSRGVRGDEAHRGGVVGGGGGVGDGDHRRAHLAHLGGYLRDLLVALVARYVADKDGLYAPGVLDHGL